MLKDNLVMLRKLKGYSQEQIAEKIGISRQAYAKWENGMTIPDIEKAALLAYDTARRIESEMEYPGQIKVTVIREVRNTDYAK